MGLIAVAAGVAGVAIAVGIGRAGFSSGGAGDSVYVPDPGGTDAYNNTNLTNNYIRMARDLNATVAPADVNQNIAIHLSFGANQVISGNTIEIQGDGISAGANFASDVALQSNTSGGAVYDGLQITNNIVRVLNAQDAANPQVVLGIWENAHGHTSDITVSGNQFVNQARGKQSGHQLAARLPRDFAFVRDDDGHLLRQLSQRREHWLPVARRLELQRQSAGRRRPATRSPTTARACWCKVRASRTSASIASSAIRPG